MALGGPHIMAYLMRFTMKTPLRVDDIVRDVILNICSVISKSVDI